MAIYIPFVFIAGLIFGLVLAGMLRASAHAEGFSEGVHAAENAYRRRQPANPENLYDLRAWGRS